MQELTCEPETGGEIHTKQPAKTSRSFLPCATTWMDHEGITLNEVSQTQKDKYHVIDLTYMWTKKKMSSDMKNRLQGWNGKIDERGQKIQTSSYKINSHGYVMYSVVTRVKNTMLHV